MIAVGIIMQLVFGILNLFKMNLSIKIFLTGVIGHYICEVSGLNRWYCKNGNACKSKNI